VALEGWSERTTREERTDGRPGADRPGSAPESPPDARSEVDLLERTAWGRDRGLLVQTADVFPGLSVAGVGDAGPRLPDESAPAGFDPDLSDRGVRAAGDSVVARHDPGVRRIATGGQPGGAGRISCLGGAHLDVTILPSMHRDRGRPREVHRGSG